MTTLDYDSLKDIFNEFISKEEIIFLDNFGHGHINDTYLVITNKNKYILQRINNKVFKNIPGLMNNISLVTNYLGREIKEEGENYKRETLTYIKTLKGDSYLLKDEKYYRLYYYIDNTITFDVMNSKNLFKEVGRIFGVFIRRLSDFDPHLLISTIPDFHNTKKRYLDYLEAVRVNIKGRYQEVKAENDFLERHKNIIGLITDALLQETIPCRVTHNDTKINNVLFDKNTEKAICVVDLDTVMPGSFLFDFGDAIRSGCNTANEDEKDLSLVKFSLDLYQAYVDATLSELKNIITEKEKEMMSISAIIITLECGMRFLTDYLAGDTYFKTNYSTHNLDRARTQFKLVEEMENNYEKMEEIVRESNK